MRNSDELRDKVASVAAGGEASIYMEPGGVFELTEPIAVSGIRLVLESDGTSGSSARRRRLGRSGRGLDGSGTGTGAILDGGGVSQLLRVTDGASVELRGVHLVNAGGSGNSDGGAAYVFSTSYGPEGGVEVRRTTSVSDLQSWCCSDPYFAHHQR